MAAEVLPSAKWLYCGEPDESQRAVLVQFSNGKLQNPDNMRFSLYKNKDSANPRKKSQRILAAETDRLSYVGTNFGTGALKCNTLCRHFVGILNKTSGQMEVYDAELFNMQPLFPDEPVESELTRESESKTFREKMDSCIEAFGTTKQKRALNSRRMNRVGNESLNRAVAKAAESIIDTKGVTALVNDALHDNVQDDSLCLPPCHADAAKPEDVYKFEDRILLVELIPYCPSYPVSPKIRQCLILIFAPKDALGLIFRGCFIFLCARSYFQRMSYFRGNTVECAHMMAQPGFLRGLVPCHSQELHPDLCSCPVLLLGCQLCFLTS
ncbi:unnamed protein product [Pipistrellus nathusii]|uniref:RNA polymerase I subunit E n=1 Tax=Pipistrellus nathusii TaxID=59473 RepID=A0ABN9Z7U0_PIPNA